MGVGTHVVIVVVLGLVKVTVVQISVPTQASAVPHPVAAMLVRREACQRVILGVSRDYLEGSGQWTYKRAPDERRRR